MYLADLAAAKPQEIKVDAQAPVNERKSAEFVADLELGQSGSRFQLVMVWKWKLETFQGESGAGDCKSGSALW